MKQKSKSVSPNLSFISQILGQAQNKSLFIKQLQQTDNNVVLQKRNLSKEKQKFFYDRIILTSRKEQKHNFDFQDIINFRQLAQEPSTPIQEKKLSRATTPNKLCRIKALQTLRVQQTNNFRIKQRTQSNISQPQLSARQTMRFYD